MRKVLFIFGTMAALIFVLAVNAAAPPNFAGTWEADKAKSQNAPRSWQDAQSVALVITQTDKQVTLETKVTGGANPAGGPGAPGGGPGGPGGGRGGGGMMGPMTYNLDGTESSTDSERGKSTSKASWSKDGSTLELNVKRTFNSPNGEITATTTDKVSLSSDGKVLTIVRHSEGPRGPQDSTLVFNKKS